MTQELPKGYEAIGGGYAVAYLRVGLAIRNPEGRDIYVQPGDAEAAMRDNIDALDEISTDVEDAKRGNVTDMILGDYFA